MVYPHASSVKCEAGFRVMVDESLLGGRYSKEKLLGSGTYGEVWRCNDQKLKRTVAVKLLHKGVKDFSHLKEEGQALSELTHKNIVIVYDIGSDKKNGWLVMELVEGPSLQSYLSELIKNKKWLAIDDSRDIVEQCLEALEFAHEKNRIHGDVKPANIFLPKTGEIKLGDFGVAKILGGTEHEKVGYIAGYERRLGTASYAAPEVLLGQPRDFQSDLFSVGILAYVLFTGQHPFYEKSGIFKIQDLITDKDFAPPKPSELGLKIPEKYEKIMMQLLEKDKNKRYKKARDVLDVWREKIELVPCPYCTNENPVSNKFCGKCGKELGVTPQIEPPTEKELSASQALFAVGKKDDAIALMRSYLAANKDFAEGWNTLGYMLNSNRQYQEAVEACSESIRIDAEQSRAFQTRGFALSNLSDYKKAIADFSKALSNESDERRQSQILYQRGYAKRLSGDFDGALKDAKVALTLDPTNSKARTLKESIENHL